MKTPDRFEKILNKYFLFPPKTFGRNDPIFSYAEILDLLRRQHRAYVRMVKQLDKRRGYTVQAFEEVLAAFEQYKAGKP